MSAKGNRRKWGRQTTSASSPSSPSSYSVEITAEKKTPSPSPSPSATTVENSSGSNSSHSSSHGNNKSKSSKTGGDGDASSQPLTPSTSATVTDTAASAAAVSPASASASAVASAAASRPSSGKEKNGGGGVGGGGEGGEGKGKAATRPYSAPVERGNQTPPTTPAAAAAARGAAASSAGGSASSTQEEGDAGNTTHTRLTPPQPVQEGRPKSVEDTKRRTSPKGSPLLRRLSTFIKGKKAQSSSSGPDRPGSRWRRHRAHAPVKEEVAPPKTHIFVEAELTQPTWCDHCDDVIWGLFKQCMQCQDCTYTCHRECAFSVTLGCRDDIAGSDSSATSSRPGSGSERAPHRTHHHPKENLADVESGAAGLLAYLSASDISDKIAEYNKTTKRKQMELLDDFSNKAFKGYIRVTLSLTRPIRVTSEDSFFNPNTSPDNTGMEDAATPLATSVRRSFQFGSGSGSGKQKRLDSGTAFYLPKDVSKGLFVTSATTSQEVISILLRKFKVVSNPRKFALYELDLSSGSKRRLRRFEEPLVLQLLWGGGNSDFVLSLQETNDDNDFQWEEFSLPELENFLRILDAEEAEATLQLNNRYEAQKRRLEDALKVKEEEGEGGEGASAP